MRLIEVVRQRHDFTPASSTAAIRRFERRSGLRLPPDMRRFYSEFDGVRLFGAEYVLLDPDAFLPLEVQVRAALGHGLGLAQAWTCFCRTPAGHLVGINLEPGTADHGAISAWLGSTTERSPGFVRVASRFTRFLGLALKSVHHPYWAAQ